MPARKPITNFSRGEFAPELYGRVDIPQYEAGAKRIENFIVQRYGGVRFRDGFRLVAPIFDNPDTPRRLVSFQFSMEQAYVLILGDESMRVAASGGMVVEEDLKIQSVTYGGETVLEVPFHDMAVGDIVYLSGNTGPNAINDRFAEVIAVPDANHIRINIDSDDSPALTASTGITRSGAPTPPPAPEPPPPPPPPPPEPPPTSGGTGGIGGGDPGTMPGYGGGYWHTVEP